MTKLSELTDLQVMVNSTIERDYTIERFSKGFVSKHKTNSWKTKDDSNLTIVIDSPDHYKYQFDVYGKGFVKSKHHIANKV